MTQSLFIGQFMTVLNINSIAMIFLICCVLKQKYLVAQ
nr:MAG TPA: hypothetical protein [Bacteriophage sp.]